MSNWYAPARVAVERQKSLRSLVASWSTCDARKVRTQSYHGVKLDTPWRLTFTVSALPWQFDLKSESAHTRQTQHFSRRLWAGELQKAVVLASFWAFLACVGARSCGQCRQVDYGQQAVALRRRHIIERTAVDSRALSRDTTVLHLGTWSGVRSPACLGWCRRGSLKM